MRHLSVGHIYFIYMLFLYICCFLLAILATRVALVAIEFNYAVLELREASKYEKIFTV